MIMLTFLFAETLVIKGASKPCHIFLKSFDLPEQFKEIEDTIRFDLESSLKFDTSFSTLPYLYKVEIKVKDISSYNCDLTINIIDNATNILQHTYHFQTKINKGNWRKLSHKISDFVFEKIQGLKGHFSSKIAFIKRFKNESVKSRLYISDYDGQNQKLLIESKDIMLGLTFSQDGQYLLYRTLHPKKGQHVWIYNLKNETTTNVSEILQKKFSKDPFGKNISSLTFGTNPSELLFAKSNRGTTTLHSFHINTEQMFSLTQPQKYIIQTCPIKSTDGKTLLFSADSGGKESIYCIKHGSYTQSLPANETLDFSQPKLCEDIRGKNRLFFSGRGRGFSSIWFADATPDQSLESINPIPVITMRKPYFVEKPNPTKNGEYVLYLQQHYTNGCVKMIDAKGNEIMQAGTYIPFYHSLGNNVTDIAIH